MSPVRIRFERYGGFLPQAMRRSYEVDLGQLSPTEESELIPLIHAADLPNLARYSGPIQAHPDAFVYEVTIENDVVSRCQFAIADPDLPDEARPLIEWLLKKSQRAGYGGQ